MIDRCLDGHRFHESILHACLERARSELVMNAAELQTNFKFLALFCRG